MNKNQIYELMNNNVGFALATIDGDVPRVRFMMLYKADDGGIVFHTSAAKDVYKQIAKNQNVELCFHDAKNNIQVRVSGTLEIVSDTAIKDEISNHPTRAFLQPWKQSVSLEDFYNSFMVFRMKDGKAVTWTMETNLAPKNQINLF